MARRVTLAALALMLVGTAFTGGCSDTPAVQVARPKRNVHWKAAALRSMAPCIATLEERPGGLSSFSAYSLDSSRAVTLWSSGPTQSPALLDVSATGPRAALALLPARPRTTADVAESLLLLEPDGSTLRIAPDPAFPLVSSAVFVGDELLVLRRSETPTSIETTLSLVTGNGDARPLELAGSVPTHDYIAGLVATPGRSRVAVVFKTPGTPAPRDDFAACSAVIEGVALRILGSPYRDDHLFTAAPGPELNGVCFTRRAEDGSAQLVSLSPGGEGFSERIARPDVAADLGLDHERVIFGGPSGALLFRVSAPAGQAPVSLRLASAASPATTPTALGFPPLGEQWAWTW